MGLRIRTNVQSLNAQRRLKASTQSVGKITERLASGYRVNRGADDAAGLAISEVLRADIRSLGQAQRNANDGVSLVEVAEGGLNEVNNIMIRLRELAIQGASDTIGARERKYLNEEFMALKNEVDRIARGTEFNGTRLLAGNAELGEELREDHNYSPIEIQVGKDYFLESDSHEAKNPVNIIRLNLSQINAMTEGEGSLGIGSAQNEEGISVETKAQAQISINTTDKAMQKIAKYRADLGAMQNRLESTDRNLSIQIENLSAAKSRIKDADFAFEAAQLTQQSILQQSGASVLAQANTQPQIALKLLGS